jgi:protein of unknwon function (DUF3310)|nr:MAG TPA: nucelotide kinase [Caudoviricetes sp.]
MSECSWDYDYKEPKEDNVNHPKHYKLGNGLETIDILEAVTVNLQGIEAVCIGNVLKYICRYSKKNGLEDLKKAQWYLNHVIEKIEKGE